MMESSITASITCGEMVWSTTEKLGKKKKHFQHMVHILCVLTLLLPRSKMNL